jgi:hypothetical protein
MKKVEDYRAHANECRLMANRARSPEDKVMLMNMAATWASLAVDRLALIDRLARMDKLKCRAEASIPTEPQTGHLLGGGLGPTQRPVSGSGDRSGMKR